MLIIIERTRSAFRNDRVIDNNPLEPGSAKQKQRGWFSVFLAVLSVNVSVTMGGTWGQELRKSHGN